MLYPVADVLQSNADLGGPAEKLVRAALLANTLTSQAQLGELGGAGAGGTLLGDTLHPPSAQAETLGTVRVLKDLALAYSEGR